jgi:ribonuclease-3
VFAELYQKIKRLFSKQEEPYLALYRILGFYPNDMQLYKQAFVHRSSSIETEDGGWKNNERLEFLGDAVLNAIVADIIYQQFPNRKEGFMTNTRSKIVQRESLNRLAVEMGLNKLLVFSQKTSSHNNYLCGNAFEALIGAIYLDQGYQKCHAFVKEKVIERYISLHKIARTEVNFKSHLIEWSQKNKLEIVFDLVDTFMDKEGNQIFQTRVSLMGMPLGAGIGFTKKESQQAAAKKAMKRIRKNKDIQLLIKELKEQNNEKENDVPAQSEDTDAERSDTGEQN